VKTARIKVGLKMRRNWGAMRYLFILLFPSLLWADKPVKTDPPQWICDGYIKGYDELDSEIANRWKTVKTFKLEGPFLNNNVVTTSFQADKHEMRVNLVYNENGRSSMFDETLKSEGISMSVGIAEKSFGGDSFQVMDGAVLPKTVGLRVDFEQDKKAYVARLVCKKNSK
jgi:hypothetical protein